MTLKHDWEFMTLSERRLAMADEIVQNLSVLGGAGIPVVPPNKAWPRQEEYYDLLRSIPEDEAKLALLQMEFERDKRDKQDRRDIGSYVVMSIAAILVEVLVIVLGTQACAEQPKQPETHMQQLAPISAPNAVVR